MRIANAKIPIQNGPHSVLSNAGYILVALGLTAGYGLIAFPVAIGLIDQAYASILFHATGDEARWAQLMDSVGIQWVMSALLAFALFKSGLLPLWLVYPLLPPVWAAWWLWADHVPSRVVAIGVQVIAILILAITMASWWEIGILVVLFGAAVWLWRSDSTHSFAHAWWHIYTAAAQGMAFWVFT